MCACQAVIKAVQQFVSELRAGGPYAKGGALAAAPNGKPPPPTAAVQPTADRQAASQTQSPSQTARLAAPAQTTKVLHLPRPCQRQYWHASWGYAVLHTMPELRRRPVPCPTLTPDLITAVTCIPVRTKIKSRGTPGLAIVLAWHSQQPSKHVLNVLSTSEKPSKGACSPVRAAKRRADVALYRRPQRQRRGHAACLSRSASIAGRRTSSRR